jgi:hypothetical protein
MIPQPGYRFSDRIMLKQKKKLESDSSKMHQTLAVGDKAEHQAG